MSIKEWFERLRQRFFSEKEEEDNSSTIMDEVAWTQADEDGANFQYASSSTIGEEVEMRVAYLYPSRSSRTEDIVEPHARKERSIKQVSSKPKKSEPPIHLEQQPVEQADGGQKEQQKKKKPFQLTRVPSAIYGFNSHPVQAETPPTPMSEPESSLQEAQTTKELTYLPEVAEERTDLPEITKVLIDLPEKNEDLHEESTLNDQNELTIDKTEVELEEKQMKASIFKAEAPHIHIPDVVKQDSVKPVMKQTFEAIDREGQLPSLSLLIDPPPPSPQDEGYIEERMEMLQQTLQQFNVDAEVRGTTQGPTVTRFEVYPGPGVKVNKITNLADDIQLSMAVEDIRMEAPIPGKSAIGIEVPNRKREAVWLRPLLTHEAMVNAPLLTCPLGLDIGGDLVTMDLQKMPHGLIAGSTGSGKSVCINSIIVSLLYRATADEVKMLLIDPKMVEFAAYDDIPHLVTPVVNDVKEATQALAWAVQEMERRYEEFANVGVRDIQRYNEWMQQQEPERSTPAMPYLVIIIDELADLMMVAPADVEESIARLAQKARACGIHLLVATQRPSVDVITGLIKANIPTRIAFSVSAQTDSRTILDMAGADKLLGRGDMLYLPNGSSKPIRLQGAYLMDEEIERVTEYIKARRRPQFLFDRELLQREIAQEGEDELFPDAVKFVMEAGQASTSALQRRFRIGYNRAARLIDMMEDQGFISASAGSKPRTVLISNEEYEEYFSLG